MLFMAETNASPVEATIVAGNACRHRGLSTMASHRRLDRAQPTAGVRCGARAAERVGAKQVQPRSTRAAVARWRGVRGGRVGSLSRELRPRPGAGSSARPPAAEGDGIDASAADV